MNGQIPPGLGAVPTIGQQRKATEQAISQAVQGLSLQIYTRLAATEISSSPLTAAATEAEHMDRLQQLARDSHAAAKAFFEGLGVAEFDEVPK